MDPDLRQAVLDVAARAEALRTGWSTAVAERRAAGSGERFVSGDTEGLLSVLPQAARPAHSNEGRWVGKDADLRFANRVVLDDQGRPLLHERMHDGYVLNLWRYERDHTEEVGYRGGQPHLTWVLHPGGARPVGAVGAGLGERWAEVWTWQGATVVRVDRGSAAAKGWAASRATAAEVDPDGSVSLLRSAIEHGKFRENNRLAEDEWLPALSEALARAARLTCEKVIWTAVANGPTTLRADVSGLAEMLAEALAGAIVEAASRSRIDTPFCVQVAPGTQDGRLLPPRVMLADESWRQGMRSHSPDDETIRSIGLAVESGAVAELDLVPFLDERVLRACAELSNALDLYADEADEAHAEPVLADLADRLTIDLAEPGRIHGATNDFLPLVALDRYEMDPLGRAMRRTSSLLDRRRVAAFTEAMRSRSPGRDQPSPELAKRALTSRDALQELLVNLGLAAHAERLAHQIAEVGLLLQASEDGRSRLGGPPLLAPGMDWPTEENGRPLSFLAAFDLAEMPPGDGRPEKGWWLFFADLGEDDRGWGFFEPTRNVEGARARVFHTAPTEDPLEAEPPPAVASGYARLRDRRVHFNPVLTLPIGYDAAVSLGLDPYESRAYEAVHQALAAALGPGAGPGHWVGGHATGAQGEQPAEDTALMLHMSEDTSLGFSFLDAGTIQFRIPRDALARGDYSAVEIEPSSC